MCPELHGRQPKWEKESKTDVGVRILSVKARIVKNWIERSHLLIHSDDFHSPTDDIYQ